MEKITPLTYPVYDKAIYRGQTTPIYKLLGENPPSWVSGIHLGQFVEVAPPKFNSSTPEVYHGWNTIVSFGDGYIFRGELLNFQGVLVDD